MYRDLREYYWWIGMSQDVVEYVPHCLTCQQVKAEHQQPSGYNSIWVIVDRLTKSAHFLQVKNTYKMEQYAKFYQATISMAHYEALYGKKCRSPINWDEVGERKMLGPEIVQKTVDIVENIH
ncbi:hypothetical protein UlMin_045654 [Ulmus minor]